MHMKVTANGIDIRCEVEGKAGAPWLIFSNSLATNLSMWDPQVKELRDRFSILRYDQRGHGGSEATKGRYTFGLLIDDVIALMNALDIARAHFCGLSMGGATALGLALLHPSRLDRVIICDSPCASTPASAQQWEERIEAARTDGMKPLVEPTIARWFPPETVAANPPHLDLIRAMILSTPVDGFVGCAAALADHDFRSGAETLRHPLLFLAGEKDGPVPPLMRQLQAAVPGSQFCEIPGAGHISNLDRPDEFNRAIERFLAGS